MDVLPEGFFDLTSLEIEFSFFRFDFLAVYVE